MVVLSLSHQLIEIVAQDSRPRDVHGTPGKNWRALASVSLLVELVRELVENDVMSVVDIGGTREHAIPRQDDYIARPRFAESGLRTLGYQALGCSLTAWHQVGRWIHKNRDKVWVVVRLAVEKENASLRGNRDTGLVGDDEAPTALKVLLREEHLDVPSEFLAIRGRQACDVGNILLDDRAPFGRKWTATNRDSSPTPKPSEHDAGADLPQFRLRAFRETTRRPIRRPTVVVIKTRFVLTIDGSLGVPLGTILDLLSR